MLKKVQSGDPLVIPAATFNTMIDAAQDFQNRRHNTHREGQREQPQTGMVLVRNDSGERRGQFDVLGISEPIISPTDNEKEFKERVAVVGVGPLEDHRGRFVVLMEPLEYGRIGRAWVSGVCICRVEMRSENHRFADVRAGNKYSLASYPTGHARLLWVQPPDDREIEGIALVIAELGLGPPAMLYLQVLSTNETEKLPDGSVPARRAPTFEDEGGDAGAFYVKAGDGGALFNGCRGLAALASYCQGQPVYVFVQGEAYGMVVELSANPIAYGTKVYYDWTQAGDLLGVDPHSSSALGRALLLSTAAGDQNLTERHVFPAGTTVFIRRSTSEDTWWFSGAVEPVYDQECPQ